MDQEIPISRERVVAYWNALIYGGCFYFLGVGLLKSALIIPLVFTCVVLRYGSRWILRAGFGILALTIMVWIGAVPPTDQWHNLAAKSANFVNPTVAVAR